MGCVVSSSALMWIGIDSSTQISRWSKVSSPQDISRAFLTAAERLAFITVLHISRMIASRRLESTDIRTGSILELGAPGPPVSDFSIVDVVRSAILPLRRSGHRAQGVSLELPGSGYVGTGGEIYGQLRCVASHLELK